MIYDHRNLLIEANDDSSFVFSLYNNSHGYLFGPVTYVPELSFTLRDDDGNRGLIRVGNAPKIDVERLSFVVETVATDEYPASGEDEDQVWFKESSAPMLKLTSTVFGNVKIRELTASEQRQMQKFKRSSQSKLLNYYMVL